MGSPTKDATANEHGCPTASPEAAVVDESCSSGNSQGRTGLGKQSSTALTRQADTVLGPRMTCVRARSNALTKTDTPHPLGTEAFGCGAERLERGNPRQAAEGRLIIRTMLRRPVRARRRWIAHGLGVRLWLAHAAHHILVTIREAVLRMGPSPGIRGGTDARLRRIARWLVTTAGVRQPRRASAFS